MPQIIVAADRGAAFGQGTVTLREGVTVADFESEHFATQLVERLGWAVEDADQLERIPGDAEPSARNPEPAEEPELAETPEPAEEPELADEREMPYAGIEDREPVSAR